MARRPRTDARTDRAAGSRTAWGPSIGLLALAVGVVGGAFAWWWSSAPAGDAVPTAQAPASAPVVPISVSVPAPWPAPPLAAAASAPQAAPPPAAASAAPPQQGRIARNRDPGGDLTPDLSDYVNEGERPTMSQVIERLRQAGVRTGLAAFNPPGTRPPLVGLAVPEDFALPQGYVRHYQATDDGQRIEAILMFAPDRPVFDAAGRAVAVPPDRVVPPELAPAGLPIRRITIPAPLDPGQPGS